MKKRSIRHSAMGLSCALCLLACWAQAHGEPVTSPTVSSAPAPSASIGVSQSGSVSYAYMAVASSTETPVTGVEALETRPPAELQPPAPSAADLPPLRTSPTEPSLEPSQAAPVADTLLTPLRELQAEPRAGSPAVDASKTSQSGSQQPFKMKEIMVYSELPAIAVFPIVTNGSEKAFGDVALLLANEYASQLETRFPKTRIHNPAYTVEQLKLQGLQSVYNQLLSYYARAGRPDPRTLAYLLDKLAGDGPPISRVVFVEANVDLHHQTTSYRPMDMVRSLHSGALPNEQRYYVNSRVEVYDPTQPQTPKLWSFSWKMPVKTTGLYNVTASVFQDSDSLSMFSMASRTLSKILTTVSPKIAYMKGERQTVTVVSGSLQKPGENADADGGGSMTDSVRRRLERLFRDPSS